MIRRDQLVELAPHYVALAILIFLVLAGVRAVVGDLHIVIELVIAVAVVSVYRPVVLRLGVAPSVWE